MNDSTDFNNVLRIIFSGSSNFSLYYLSRLFKFKKKYKVVGVITKLYKGFKKVSDSSINPIKVFSDKNGIDVLQKEKLKERNDSFWIKEKNADIMIVVDCGLFFPRFILDTFPLGCINVHPSLLPKWRGASPIQHAILTGDKETGITIIRMNSVIDGGPILYQVKHPIFLEDTSLTLSNRLKKIGFKSLYRTLNLLKKKKIIPIEQNEKNVSYARKLNKRDTEINWNMSSESIKCFVQAFDPWPGSYFIKKGKIVKVWKAEVKKNFLNQIPGTILKINKKGIEVATKNSAINITCIQLEGRKKMSSKEFLNSNRKLFQIGELIYDSV